MSEAGTYRDLMRASGEFAEVIREYLLKDRAVSEEDEDLQEVLSELEKVDPETRSKLQRQISQTTQSSHSHSVGSNPVVSSIRQTSVEREKQPLLADATKPNEVSKQIQNGDVSPQKQKKGEKIIGKEEVLTGKVKFTVYSDYLKAVGLFVCTIFVVIYIWSSVLAVCTNLWLAHWSDHAKEVSDKIYLFYILRVTFRFKLAIRFLQKCLFNWAFILG